MPMTISRRILAAAGTALVLALPAVAEAQQAEGAKDYPPCSATVTDSCMQHEGGAKAKAHHARHAAHHRMAQKKA